MPARTTLAASARRMDSSSEATSAALASLTPARLHDVDCLEHRRDRRPPGLRRLGLDVSVEVYGAALVGCVREHLGDAAHHAGGLVPGEHAHAAQAARAEPREELPPALRGLGEALRGPDGLAAPLPVDADIHHHRHVLVRAAPRVLEVDAVDVDVGVGVGPVQ